MGCNALNMMTGFPEKVGNPKTSSPVALMACSSSFATAEVATSNTMRNQTGQFSGGAFALELRRVSGINEDKGAYLIGVTPGKELHV